MLHFSIFNSNNLPLGLLLLLPAILTGQLAGVPCICETTSLELTPMIQQPKIVLISNPDNSSLRWEYDQAEEPEEVEPTPEPETLPVPDPEIDQILKSNHRNGPRSNLPRKRKSRSKIKLKKRGFKKYRGQCPVF